MCIFLLFLAEAWMLIFMAKVKIRVSMLMVGAGTREKREKTPIRIGMRNIDSIFLRFQTKLGTRTSYIDSEKVLIFFRV